MMALSINVSLITRNKMTGEKYMRIHEGSVERNSVSNVTEKWRRMACISAMLLYR